MQFTNREITQKNQSVRVFFEPTHTITDMLVMVCVGLLLGYLGPFGSADALKQWAYAYWITVCLIGFWVYAPIIHFGDLSLQRFTQSYRIRIALATSIASLLMATIVPIITNVFFQTQRPWLDLFITALPKTLVIGSAISIVTLLKSHLRDQKLQILAAERAANEQPSTTETKDSLAAAKAIIEQLPANKRGQLLAIETQDHYLKIYTDKGHHLVLMRLKDALTVLQDYPGLQIHRSWWVAEYAIKEIQKADRKVWLVLTNEVQAPVSRTYAAEVKKRGWL